jgi:hypothetical protein
MQLIDLELAGFINCLALLVVSARPCGAADDCLARHYAVSPSTNAVAHQMAKIFGHASQHIAARDPRIGAWSVEYPGDYATLNSYQHRDGIGLRPGRSFS